MFVCLAKQQYLCRRHLLP